MGKNLNKRKTRKGGILKKHQKKIPKVPKRKKSQKSKKECQKIKMIQKAKSYL